MRELTEPFERLLSEISTPAQVRAVEGSGDAAAIWSAIEESGFIDALVPEADGGAGLPFAAVRGLLLQLGSHAVPVPVGETMIARKLIVQAGLRYPAGPIVLSTPVPRNGGFAQHAVPFARVADHALVQVEDRLILAPLSGATVQDTGVGASLAANLAWTNPPAGPSLPAPEGGLRPIAAILRSAAIAGAGDRLLNMTIDYANARVQFGKPIGRQQIIQQQLAVMAEHVVMARIATEIGAAGGLPPSIAAAATAKQVTSKAAARIAAIAHAVHGAIGMSEEYDLQLFSRRLYEWRLAGGSETYWSMVLGQERLAAHGDSIDFIRERLSYVPGGE